MDDFQWGLIILGGVAVVAGIGLGALILIQSSTAPQPSAIKNKESWEWTDWRGRQRTLIGHRKVEPATDENVIKL